jgi:hypothetical protein
MFGMPGYQTHTDALVPREGVPPIVSREHSTVLTTTVLGMEEEASKGSSVG